MPRRYARKRMYRKKKRVGRFKRLEKKVAKISKSIEHKFSDHDFDLTLDWDGDIVLLNGIGVGITDSDRIGDKAMMTSLAINYNLERNNAGDFPTVRVMLIWDKQNTIATPGDVLLYGAGAAFSYLSMLVVDDRNHFVVLSDKFYQLDSAGPNDLIIKLRKKLNKVTRFDGGSSTVVQGALKLIVFASTDSAAANKALLHGYARVRYTDL